MLRAKYVLMTLAFSLLPVGCTPMGCSGEDPDHDLSVAEQEKDLQAAALPTPTPGASMYGTWMAATPQTGMFEKLALMTDGRYHGERKVVCIKDPCYAVPEDGTYKLYTRDAKTFLSFTTTGNTQTDRYEYVYSNREFKIRPLRPGSEWYTLLNAGSAWCAIDRDCAAQALPPGPCAGGWVCGSGNVCKWDCPRPSEATGANEPVAPGAANPGTCPATADCVIAADQCAKNARDPDSCGKDALCKKCFPNGLLAKPVPDTKEPITDPLLKK
jgi:hypothetical protein